MIRGPTAGGEPRVHLQLQGQPAYRTIGPAPKLLGQADPTGCVRCTRRQGNIYLAFREFTSGVYWNGIYDTVEDSLELYRQERDAQLRHFMKNNKMPLGESIPRLEACFEPNNPNVIDRQAQTVNIYNLSNFLQGPSARACRLPRR